VYCAHLEVLCNHRALYKLMLTCFVVRVKKKERDREELWQKLDDLHVAAATVTTSTLNSKSPET